MVSTQIFLVWLSCIELKCSLPKFLTAKVVSQPTGKPLWQGRIADSESFLSFLWLGNITYPGLSWFCFLSFSFMGIQKYCVNRKHTALPPTPPLSAWRDLGLGLGKPVWGNRPKKPRWPLAPPSSCDPRLACSQLGWSTVSTAEVLGARQMVPGWSVDLEKPQKKAPTLFQQNPEGFC